MGASGWDFFVPYQVDMNAALVDACRRAFAAGDYFWPYEFYREILPSKPRPETPQELFDDEHVRESGLHSVLDMYKVIAAGEKHDIGTVRPLTEEEVRTHLRTDRPTRAMFEETQGHDDGNIWVLGDRWQGFCTVLYSDEGDPLEIVFWGYSGD